MVTSDSRPFTYTFHPVESCNMCGALSETQKVLGRRLNRSQGARPQRRVGIATTVVRCNECSLVFSNPMPVPSSIGQHYGVPPESYWSPKYFELDPSYFSAQIDTAERLTGQSERLKVLDVGAGVGKAMRALGARGHEAYGFEPSEPFFERAVSAVGIAPDRIQLASVETAEYAEGAFDVVTFGAVLEHVYDPSGSVERALTWLRPGGFLHVEVPSSRWLTNKLINLAYRLRGLDYVGNISPMHRPFHLYEFGLRSFESNSRRTGYDVAEHRYLSVSTRLPRVLDPLTKPLMEKTNSVMQLEVWLQRPAA